LQKLVRRVPVTDHCIDYAMDLVRATRGPEHGGPAYVGQWVAWGAGPRAGQSLILASKARAALEGRPSVTIEDIRAVTRPVRCAVQPPLQLSRARYDNPARPLAALGLNSRRVSMPLYQIWPPLPTSVIFP